MSLSINRSAVKAMLRISVSDYDNEIDALISQQTPVVEYMIANEYLSQTSNAGLQATLNLGALEVVSGEFMAQLVREEASIEQIKIGDLVIGEPTNYRKSASVTDPYGLKDQGLKRLKPFMKASIALQAETDIRVQASDEIFTAEELERW